MAIELDVLVEVSYSRRRYVVHCSVGVEEYECPFPCFYCGGDNARTLFVVADQVTRVTTRRELSSSLLSWLDATCQAERQLGAGKPICVNCWDEEELPSLHYFARRP